MRVAICHHDGQTGSAAVTCGRNVAQEIIWQREKPDGAYPVKRDAGR